MDNELYKQDSHFLGSGWSFPVTFSAGNHQLNLTKYEENIRDSIQVILHTKIGERSMYPNFGSGMSQFMFKTMNETLKGGIIHTVKDALLENEPRITVEDVDVEFTDLEKGMVEIAIKYVYNNTNTRHNYVFPFHLKEGTNL